ncbi:MAG: cytochrome ubiquinol oxidase subunit I [Streptosporangiales bacterium]|nr:cytochrome ubiquinol oxidase subunit I [Streptosporangiales bacterium]
MDVLDLARLQFGMTTVYHFLFVPLSMGLSAIVAGFQTAWLRTGDDRYLRLTRFFGGLLVVNFAVGVPTGLVQELQFGMNWSAFSVFVGEVLGVPLALEALLAFFLESTFLGLWIFGWDRLPARVHLGCMWAVAIGTQLSAYVILAANSWMQHPVGFAIDPETGRATLTDFVAVLTSEMAVVAYAHTAAASFVTAGALVAGISFWHLARRNQVGVFRIAARAACAVVLVAGIGVAVSGDMQGKVMSERQPMKMAAAEAIYETSAPASFSVFTIGTLDGREEIWSLRVPYVSSFLATGRLDGTVEGIDDVQREYVATYGPGDYLPNVPATYWNFRLMIGFGMTAVVASLAGLLLLRRWDGRGRGRRRRRSARGDRWVARAALTLPLLPLLANSAGWVFTETGRQPWLAFGLFRTADGVSPGTTASEVVVSLVAFAAVYAVLAVVEVGLLARLARKGAPPVDADADSGDGPDADAPLALSY